jgi:hypothetical protein
LWFVLLFCFAVGWQPLQAQAANRQETPMKHFAMIFYPTRTLTAQELQQRKVEIATWAKQATAMGITLDPRSFTGTAEKLSLQGGAVVSQEEAALGFSNIVFFDAPSLDQAVQIARLHPGLHYGAAVEVREWTSPLETQAKRPVVEQ